MEIETNETRDCLQCPSCRDGISSLDETMCNETIFSTVRLSVDSITIPEMTLKKTETKKLAWNTDCVCWEKDREFRRVGDAIGFSSQPDSSFQPGEYRMVNSARQLYIYLGKSTFEFFENKYANHNF